MKREKKLQNQLWKERMPLIASFFLPFFILTVICIFHDVYPFGEQCILHIDMYHQYCPFFTELMDKIKHGGSMFYSWNIGLVDVPMIKTFINGYSNSEYVIDSVMEKLMGRSNFTGKSPVDPFCGKEYLKW